MNKRLGFIKREWSDGTVTWQLIDAGHKAVSRGGWVAVDGAVDWVQAPETVSHQAEWWELQDGIDEALIRIDKEAQRRQAATASAKGVEARQTKARDDADLYQDEADAIWARNPHVGYVSDLKLRPLPARPRAPGPAGSICAP